MRPWLWPRLSAASRRLAAAKCRATNSCATPANVSHNLGESAFSGVGIYTAQRSMMHGTGTG